jgi:hypothetical protein
VPPKDNNDQASAQQHPTNTYGDSSTEHRKYRLSLCPATRAVDQNTNDKMKEDEPSKEILISPTDPEKKLKIKA